MKFLTALTMNLRTYLVHTTGRSVVKLAWCLIQQMCSTNLSVGCWLPALNCTSTVLPCVFYLRAEVAPVAVLHDDAEVVLARGEEGVLVADDIRVV